MKANATNGLRGPKDYPGFDLKSSPWNWTNVVFLVLLHSIGIYAIVRIAQHGMSPSVFWWTLALSVFTSLGVTVGYHRYATHRGFTANNEWIEGILLFAGGTAVEGPLARWRYVHLVHHAFTDKVNWDPHTPKQFKNPVGGFLWSHMGWFFKNTELVRIQEIPETRLVRLQRRYYAVNVAATFLIPWMVAGFDIDGFLIGGVLRVMILLHATACINSVAHFWGDQLEAFRARKSNQGATARNVFFWIGLWILSFGESWHNNHHHLEPCVAHGWTKLQIDFSKWVIWTLEKLHLISNVRWMEKERALALSKEPK
ncbi:MAG: acyl-CoA desaturase [Candidatus Saccharimonadales bacterium]